MTNGSCGKELPQTPHQLLEPLGWDHPGSPTFEPHAAWLNLGILFCYFSPISSSLSQILSSFSLPPLLPFPPNPLQIPIQIQKKDNSRSPKPSLTPPKNLRQSGSPRPAPVGSKIPRRGARPSAVPFRLNPCADYAAAAPFCGSARRHTNERYRTGAACACAGRYHQTLALIYIAPYVCTNERVVRHFTGAASCWLVPCQHTVVKGRIVWCAIVSG